MGGRSERPQERGRASSHLYGAEINPTSVPFDVRQIHDGGNTAAAMAALNAATANISPAR